MAFTAVYQVPGKIFMINPHRSFFYDSSILSELAGDHETSMFHYHMGYGDIVLYHPSLIQSHVTGPVLVGIAALFGAK